MSIQIADDPHLNMVRVPPAAPWVMSKSIEAYYRSRGNVVGTIEEMKRTFAGSRPITTLILTHVKRPREFWTSLVRDVIAHAAHLEKIDCEGSDMPVEAIIMLAEVLRVNTTIRWLNLPPVLDDRKNAVDEAFIVALRVNPGRPADSWWRIYCSDTDYERLRAAARL